ncbi:hypothetical protein IPG36_05880 [bacterium]|nr:MAG: hypothetical protein IPG36_05880 [bacterium]
MISKFDFSQERTENFVAAIRERATLIVPNVRLAGSVSDPDDEMILGAL